MKGTIFERGNKFVNKFHRACAWFRVKKYWLFMDHKTYKSNIFYNILGMITAIVAWAAALYVGVAGIVYGIVKLIDWKKEKDESRVIK